MGSFKHLPPTTAYVAFGSMLLKKSFVIIDES
jgi:hypothetical protein